MLADTNAVAEPINHCEPDADAHADGIADGFGFSERVAERGGNPIAN